MGVSENSGTPKSSILKRFSIINHPFWGTPIFGNTHMTARVPVFTKNTIFSYPKRTVLFVENRRWALRLMHGTSGKHGWGLPSRIKDGFGESWGF